MGKDLLLDMIGEGEDNDIFDAFGTLLSLFIEERTIIIDDLPKERELQALNAGLLRHKLDSLERKLQNLDRIIPSEGTMHKTVTHIKQVSFEIITMWDATFRVILLENSLTYPILTLLKVLNQRAILLRRVFTDASTINISSIYFDICKLFEHELHFNTLIKKGSKTQKFGFSMSYAQDVLKRASDSTQIRKWSLFLYIPDSIPDGKDTFYINSIRLWIDTKNPAEANRFMSIIASVLSSIENVHIELEDAGVGSAWQRWKTKIKGWLAKEDVKNILEKGGETARAIIVDKHTEPVKKIKVERQLKEKELGSAMSKEQAQQLNEIKIKKARQDLETQALANELTRLEIINKKIDIQNKLSEALANGLSTIDSDFSIEIGGLLSIGQKEKKLTIGDHEAIDKTFEKREGSKGEEPAV